MVEYKPRIATGVGRQSLAELVADSYATSWIGETAVAIGDRLHNDNDLGWKAILGYPGTPGFNAFEEFDDIEEHEYTAAKNSQSRAQFLHYRRTREILMNTEERLVSEGAGWARFIAGIPDPVNFIPLPLGRGIGLLKGAGRGGVILGGTSVALEAQREFLPVEDTEGLIGTFSGGFLFGAAFGGVAGKMPGKAVRNADQFLKDIDDTERGMDPTQRDLRAGGPKTPEETTIARANEAMAGEARARADALEAEVEALKLRVEEAAKSKTEGPGGGPKIFELDPQKESDLDPPDFPERRMIDEVADDDVATNNAIEGTNAADQKALDAAYQKALKKAEKLQKKAQKALDASNAADQKARDASDTAYERLFGPAAIERKEDARQTHAGRESVIASIKRAIERGDISASEGPQIAAVLEALPHQWFDGISLAMKARAEWSTGGIPPAGSYEAMQKLVSLFFGSKKAKGKTALIMGHEWGHHAWYWFLDKAGFNEAKALWLADTDIEADVRRLLGEASEVGTNPKTVAETALYQADLGEWFANQVMHAALRRGGHALKLKNAKGFEKIGLIANKALDEIISFTRRLAASYGLATLTHRELVENFMDHVLDASKNVLARTDKAEVMQFFARERIATGQKLKTILADMVLGHKADPMSVYIRIGTDYADHIIKKHASFVGMEPGNLPDDVGFEKAMAVTGNELARLQAQGTSESDLIAQRGHEKLAPTGIGIEKTRMATMPYYLMMNNILGGSLGDIVSRLSQQLAGFNLRTIQNQSGIASDQSVFSRSVQWSARYVYASRSMNENYMRYIGGLEDGGPMSDYAASARDLKERLETIPLLKKGIQHLGLATAEGKITYRQFREQVFLALNDGDKHPDPWVQKSAVAWRSELDAIEAVSRELGFFGTKKLEKEIVWLGGKLERTTARYDKWNAILQERIAEGEGNVGRLTKMVDQILEKKKATEAELDKVQERLKLFQKTKVFAAEGSSSYAPIRWSLEAIDSNPDELRQIFYNHFKMKRPRATEEETWDDVTLAMGRVRKLASREPLFHDKMDPIGQEQTIKEQRAAIADQTERGIMREEAGDDPSVQGFVPTSTLSRKLDIPASVIKKFLDTDIDSVMKSYIQSMGAAIEMARLDFRLSGEASPSLSGTIAHLEQLVKDRFLAGEGPELLLEWGKQKKAIEDLVGKVLGIYGIPEDPTAISHRILATAKNYSTMMVMGKTFQSAFGDAGTSMISLGVRGFIGGMFDRFAGLAPEFRLALKDVERAGEATDIARSLSLQRYQLQQEGAYTGKTMVERFASEGANKMHLLNLLGIWTDFIKGFSGAMLQSKLIEDSLSLVKGEFAGSRTGAKKIEFLASYGIDKNQARVIIEQWEAAGAQKGRRLYLANTEKWADQIAAENFRSSLGDAIRNAVVTPGPGDRPNFMSSPVWSVVLQYRGFSIAATQRIAMMGLQSRDKQTLSGMMALIGIGYMIDMLKSTDYDKRGLFSGERLIRAVEYSGITGVIGDINNMIEVASGNSYGVRPILGLDPLVKDPNWAERTGQITGPASSPWLGALWAMTSAEASTHDQGRAAIRMIPFNNWWAVNNYWKRVGQEFATPGE